MLIECGTKNSTEGSNPSLSAIKIDPGARATHHVFEEDHGLKLRTLAICTVAGALFMTGCAARTPVPPGARNQGDDLAPGYFTQATETGYRYAHNWVDRPCFTIDLPGTNWVLQSATADYVLWHKGDHALKVYLADNRAVQYAVAGMSPEGALRAFIGYELDFIRPKFEKQISPAPSLRTNDTGLWALWRWEGRIGRRAGVGRPQPADQRHLLASLWLDPWVISFDWATTNLQSPDVDSPELVHAVRSLTFYPQCFQQMRSGETWTTDDGAGAHLSAPRVIPEDASTGPTEAHPSF